MFLRLFVSFLLLVSTATAIASQANARPTINENGCPPGSVPDYKVGECFIKCEGTI